MPTITAEIGTTGEHESVEVGIDHPSADLLAAVKLEHPCDDRSCDIAEATREGFGYVAAYLLGGATETPLLDAVMQWHGFDGTNLRDGEPGAEMQAWEDHMVRFGHYCGSCGSTTFTRIEGTRPETCANCGEKLATWEVGQRLRLLRDEADLADGDIERVTPAGSIVEIVDFSDGLYGLVCRETGGWFRVEPSEMSAEVEALNE